MFFFLLGVPQTSFPSFSEIVFRPEMHLQGIFLDEKNGTDAEKHGESEETVRISKFCDFPKNPKISFKKILKTCLRDA